MKKVVLADCHYFGTALRIARKRNHLNQKTAAKLLKISIPDLQQYERGREIIPDTVILQIMHHGLLLLYARNIPYIPREVDRKHMRDI